MSTFTPAHLGPRYLTNAVPLALTESQREIRRHLLAEDGESDWEHASCLCGAVDGRVLTDVDRYALPYRKVLCTTCGLLRVTPRWTAARYARFYADHYRDLYSPLRGESGTQTLLELWKGPGARLVSAFVADAWRKYGDTQRQPVIVEIGSGGGWNLSRLPDHWTRIGYDTDDRFLQLGRKAFGVDLRKGFLDEALSAVAGADCVLLSHVLEHVADPVQTLRALSRAARPDALILVEVPGIFRLHKTSLDPMRYWQNAHTFTFCARTALDTCRRAGLEPLAVDEWIRLVLCPSRTFTDPVKTDGALARSIERYLRYCEFSGRIARRSASLPGVGGAFSAGVRRAADLLVRTADALQLIEGMRAGRAGVPNH